MVVGLTTYSYLQDLESAGIEIYWHQPGFMHQKVLLIDSGIAAIGTANFDTRSMRLNFEVTLLLVQEACAGEVEKMLKADLANSRLASAKEYSDRSLPFRFAVRVCRLFAPIQ